MAVKPHTGKGILAACLFLAMSFSGCILEDRNIYEDPEYRDFFREPFDYPEEPEPLEYTYFRIGQTQRAGPGATYEGSLVFTYCTHNPNLFDVQNNHGWDVFQVMGPPDQGELRSVNTAMVKNDTTAGNVTVDPLFPYHDVYQNETAEGNSTEYRIHLWQEILLGPEEPIHRVDKWFDVTFVPYGPENTTHEEGEPCSSFQD